ncbi:hypothetical protein CYMTET_39293 [Cymbomonas tetramitiformis]|uniref:RRM domain-containing protein n=1 Tax=Cymbomonas tetramitiformis TaxID=36881 RepID=A0AAE0F4M5_9CHLO|nr:hypothetical protein CYMTET_39293 [Cymbomonas tetramitiformis]
MGHFEDVPTPFLFICDISEEVEDAAFSALFAGLEGLKAVRGPRRDRGGQKVAFADFDSESSAITAKAKLSGYEFTPTAGAITVKFSGQPKRGGDRNREEPHSKFPRRDGHQNPRGYEQYNAPPMIPQMPPHMMDGSGMGLPSEMFPGVNPNPGVLNPGLALAMQDPAQMMRAPLPFQPQLKDSFSAQPATVYVEGIPADATEREVSHLFRVFPGYQSLRLKPQMSRSNETEVHHYLCFVEFTNEGEASTCMSYLQGYVFDEKNPERRIKLSFASTERKRRF